MIWVLARLTDTLTSRAFLKPSLPSSQGNWLPRSAGIEQLSLVWWYPLPPGCLDTLQRKDGFLTSLSSLPPPPPHQKEITCRIFNRFMGLCSGVSCFHSVWDEMRHLSAEASDDVGPPSWARVTVACRPQLGGSSEELHAVEWENFQLTRGAAGCSAGEMPRFFLSGLTLAFSAALRPSLWPAEAVSLLSWVLEFNFFPLRCPETILLKVTKHQ